MTQVEQVTCFRFAGNDVRFIKYWRYGIGHDIRFKIWTWSQRLYLGVNLFLVINHNVSRFSVYRNEESPTRFEQGRECQVMRIGAIKVYIFSSKLKQEFCDVSKSHQYKTILKSQFFWGTFNRRYWLTLNKFYLSSSLFLDVACDLRTKFCVFYLYPLRFIHVLLFNAKFVNVRLLP